MRQHVDIIIEKLVFGGTALGKTTDGQHVFVWNALPGERITAEVIRKKRTYFEAIATQFLTQSPDRIDPIEPHFLSSSPWGIMTEEREQAEKVNVAREIFIKNGGITLPENLTIHTDGISYGYRNKIEFSFTENTSGDISLAFFVRGERRKIPVQTSALAEPVINAIGEHILDWIRTSELTTYNLKSLIIRSNGRGEAIAALFIKDELELNSFPELRNGLVGFQLYYSTHKSPASVPTKLIHRVGKSHLTAELLGTQLNFGLHSFFQVNIPVFEAALQDIMAVVYPDVQLLDLYAGVGSIGLPVSRVVKHCTLVDVNEEATDFARQNIKANDIENCNVITTPSENALHEITHDKIVIVDPPRAGLHKDVTEKLLTELPPRIIYLSCGLDTQARDIGLLSNAYRISDAKLYNFFPRTPHIESLIVLDRMKS